MSKSLLVCTHHKCASSFVGLYLRRLAEISGLTYFTSHFGDAVPASDTHLSFLTNSNYPILSPHLTSSHPAIHVIRNPLSVVSSAYFSHLQTHATDDWPRLVVQRHRLKNLGREEGLRLTVAFLEDAEFYPRTPGPLRAMTEWNYDDPRVITLRMEDIVTDVASFGHRLADAFSAQMVVVPPSGDFTFDRFAGGRPVGVRDETSHYRVGLPDAWRDDLSESIVTDLRQRYRMILERFYPEAL